MSNIISANLVLVIEDDLNLIIKFKINITSKYIKKRLFDWHPTNSY